MPPVLPPHPKYPFQLVSSDYFTLQGHNFIVMVDRYSNWPVVCKCKTETSKELISALREFFCTHGVPIELATDGGTNYIACNTQDFLQTWGVTHRVSSAYNPHSNLIAETAVKTVKRIISDNVDGSGSLDNDKMATTLFTYRNTPDRDTAMSPSMILFSRQMKDTVPCNPEKLQLRKKWVFTAQEREKALAKRHLSRHTDLLSKSKPLKPLVVGNTIQVQNQHGNNPNKWDFSETIVEV